MFFADTVREEVAFGLTNLGITDTGKLIDRALENARLLHTGDLYPRGSPAENASVLRLPALSRWSPRSSSLMNRQPGLTVTKPARSWRSSGISSVDGHTVIVITHNREIALHCADRIITMDKGTIISDTRVEAA